MLQVTTNSPTIAEGCEDAMPTILGNSMNKKLFDSTEEHRQRRELIEYCPSFDLGLEESPREDHAAAATDGPTLMSEENVISCSNEDSGDSFDKIYATIEMPTRTQAREKDKKVHEVTFSPNDPNSVTPIPQAHQRRVLKLGPTKKSPFVDIERKAIASKTKNKLYNKVCAYTGKDANDPNEEPIIIDDSTWYINLKDLADSVRPGGLLRNSTCQMALNDMSVEMAKQKKFLMPLRIAGKLRKATCFLDNSVKKAFANCPANRLDHKELVERFEVMESLRREGDKGLHADYRAIIGSIKNMWARNYSQNSISQNTKHCTSSLLQCKARRNRIL